MKLAVCFLFPLHLFIHFTHLPGAVLVTVHSFNSFIWFHSQSTWRATPFRLLDLSTYHIKLNNQQALQSSSVQSSPIQASFQLDASLGQPFTSHPAPLQSKDVIQHQKPLLHRPSRRRPRVPGLPPREASCALVQRPRPKRGRCRSLSLFSLVCFVETTSKMVVKR